VLASLNEPSFRSGDGAGQLMASHLSLFSRKGRHAGKLVDIPVCGLRAWKTRIEAGN
jgi:hypothetical protein